VVLILKVIVKPDDVRVGEFVVNSELVDKLILHVVLFYR
jgi:hypothetical protein